MTEEAFCSNDVVKLLHEKGFDGYCTPYSTMIVGGTVPQSVAMKWLREQHNVDIVTFHERLPNDVYWSRIEKYPYTEHQQEPIYKKYEEAVETALKYVLENLI